MPIPLIDKMAEPQTVDLPFRVRYSETDQMGVAYYANHLVWFEIGRAEYCRACGFPYSLIEEEGYIMVVADASVRYKRPAHYDDPLIVRTALTSISSKVIRFGYQIINQDTSELLAEGETTHVVVDREKGRPIKMPQSYVNILKGLPKV